jgi:hypothetical protein
MQEHRKEIVEHILVGIRVELQFFTVCIVIRNFDPKIRTTNTQG